MNNPDNQKTAILVISFGTSFPETRKKTIDKIEEDIQGAFGGFRIFRAWTSGMIRRKLEKRDGLHIMDVTEAMESILKEGYTSVVVQPTHVINGIESEKLKEQVLSFENRFERILLGKPLLSSDEDIQDVIQALKKELDTPDKDTVVFMGHGTEHAANEIYLKMDKLFKEMGLTHFHMATVEARPTIEDVLEELKEDKDQKIILTPFMIVAGDHANNDLAGDEEDSWKNIAIRHGFCPQCVLKGLGEYQGIRNIYLRHIKEALEA